jgi:ATP-dependent DNA ligase
LSPIRGVGGTYSEDPTRTASHSETFGLPLKNLIAVVCEKRLEGIVAKHVDSTYKPGKRSGDWLKGRANLGQEFVIDGYIPGRRASDNADTNSTSHKVVANPILGGLHHEY